VTGFLVKRRRVALCQSSPRQTHEKGSVAVTPGKSSSISPGASCPSVDCRSDLAHGLADGIDEARPAFSTRRQRPATFRARPVPPASMWHIFAEPTFLLCACLAWVQGRLSGPRDSRRRRGGCAARMKDFEEREARPNRDLVRTFRPDDQIDRKLPSRRCGSARALQIGRIYWSRRARNLANPFHGAAGLAVNISFGGQLHD
jgi:hypothetical protein